MFQEVRKMRSTFSILKAWRQHSVHLFARLNQD